GWRQTVEKAIGHEIGIGAQVRLAGGPAHQLREQRALGHRKAAGPDGGKEQVAMVDAAKLTRRDPLLDHRGKLVAGVVDQIVAQLARGLGLAVDDPLDDEMIQRWVWDNVSRRMNMRRLILSRGDVPSA